MAPNPSVTALVPAAGSSRRMGQQDLPKILLEIHGVTVLQRTVQTLARCPSIRDVVILAPEPYLGAVRALPFKIPNSCQLHVIAGGETRQRSVQRGLEHVRSFTTSPDFVLVHDAARCLVSDVLVQRCIEEAYSHGAVTAGVEAVDSLKFVAADGTVERSLPRERIRAIQTPQVFRTELLERAHRDASPHATDDASLVEPFHPVRVVEGDPTNVKITRTIDLTIAEHLLTLRAQELEAHLH
jgi:2-C-methyl-D-erythritol 4-phosphate cytidylyltransferase